MGKKDKLTATAPEPKPGKTRRLSAISRLHANTMRVDKHAGTYMYGLIYFKDKVPIEVIRDLVKEKLLAIPRFRSCLKPSKFRKKEQFVELAVEDIDLEYHVREVEQEMTRDEVLKDYIDDAFKNWEFNLEIPMWQFTYFKNMEGRSLLLFTVNHAIGDGVSIVEVLYRLMDKPGDEVAVKTADIEAPAEEEDGGDDEEEEEGDDEISIGAPPALEDTKQQVRPPKKRGKPKNGFGPLNKARIFLGGAVKPFFQAFGSPDTPSPLMRAPGVEAAEVKSTAYTDNIPLEKIKEIKSRFPGATINDILVGLLTMTINAYLRELAETTSDDAQRKSALALLDGKGKMRASFPISVRKRGEDAFRDHSPHNKIALGELRFQLKYPTRTQLVYDVKRTLDAIKLSPTPFVQQKLANTFISVLSKKGVTQMFKKIGEQSSCMLSNVPGPAEKVRLRGYEVDDLSFALNAGQPLYLGLLSYAGGVSCCVCADSGLVPDSKEIAKHWKTEFDALYEEVLAHGETAPNTRGCTKCLDKL